MASGGGRSPFQVSLRATERRALKRAARSQAAPHRQVVRARIVLDAAAGLPSTLIARRVGVAPTRCTSGASGFAPRGMRACGTGPALAARGRSRRRWSPRPRRSPASCPPPEGCRLAAGAWPSCARSCWPVAWSPRCRPRRCGAGWPRMPSSRGSTAPGSSPATPRSPPRPPGSSTCTREASRVPGWARVSTSSRRTRRPRSRRAAAAIPPCRQGAHGPCGWSTSTNAAARWPTWLPGTSTGRACSAVASPPLGSSRSGGWWPRS